MKKVVIIITLVIAIVGYFAYDYFSAVVVETEEVVVGEVIDSISERAELRVRRRANILAQINGSVLRVNYQIGNMVEKDQEIIIIKASDLEYEIEVLKERLKQAKISYRQLVEPEELLVEKAKIELEIQELSYEYAKDEFYRAESLLDRGILTKGELDQLELNYHSAKRMYLLAKSNFQEVISGGSAYQREQALSQISEIELNIARMENAKDNYHVKAPFDGTIVSLDVNQGDTVLPGNPLFQVAELESTYLYLEILASRADEIAVGQKAYLPDESSTNIEKIHPIAVERVSDLGIRQKRIGVELGSVIELKNVIGSEVEVEIILEEREDVLTISRDSIFNINNKYYAFLIEENHIKQVEVKLGLMTSDKVEVVQGLKEGDLIVSVPSTELQDGQRIKY